MIYIAISLLRKEVANGQCCLVRRWRRRWWRRLGRPNNGVSSRTGATASPKGRGVPVPAQQTRNKYLRRVSPCNDPRCSDAGWERPMANVERKSTQWHYPTEIIKTKSKQACRGLPDLESSRNATTRRRISLLGERSWYRCCFLGALSIRSVAHDIRSCVHGAFGRSLDVRQAKRADSEVCQNQCRRPQRRLAEHSKSEAPT
jgi:hypothetical protein